MLECHWQVFSGDTKIQNEENFQESVFGVTKVFLYSDPSCCIE